MAEKLNVYAKLFAVRRDFIAQGVKKTGKNMNLAYTYFELDDIIPQVTPLFDKYGLIVNASFDEVNAYATVVNLDDPSDRIVFTTPYEVVEPIITSSGKRVDNSAQRRGSTITYFRRYLYQLVLDLVEVDAMEQNAKEHLEESTTPAPTTTNEVKEVLEPKKDASKEEVVKTLTNVDGNADALQIKGLKNLLKEVKKVLPDGEQLVSEVITKTDKFTKLSKAECEIIMTQLNEKLTAYKDLREKTIDLGF